MVVLADRGFCGYPVVVTGPATGADLLWRAKPNMTPRHLETLSDGSWLAELRPGGNAGRNAEPLIVRVIDFEHRRRSGQQRPPIGCSPPLSTRTRPPRSDLALAYAQRWEIESTFDELKTHQRGPRTVLRSKSPDLVAQEIWGHLCCHYAIRTLMWEAADHARVDPDRVSFVAALRIARRSIPAARDFPPQPTDHGWRHAIALLCRRLNPLRRQRSNPRLIKRKIRQMARQTRPTPQLATTHRANPATIQPPN